MRLPTVDYVYGDPLNPDRVTGAVSSPPYTREDRALLMGLELYEASLCACGVPIALAWHSEMDGYYEADEAVCHVCTVRKGKQAVYATNLRNTRDMSQPMPPFVPGKTISTPDTGPT